MLDASFLFLFSLIIWFVFSFGGVKERRTRMGHLKTVRRRILFRSLMGNVVGD
ncbi:hypothetical protein BVRB_8g190120 [Beta vulgaris subsp. vulgaris]|nr:hypothetical protein BVRB_8g190120 [Beta vulgaris subsp. vulgaris]